MMQITFRKSGRVRLSRSDPIGIDPVDFRTLPGKKLDESGKILDESGKILDASRRTTAPSH
jgi:hypothetical protein